MSDIQRLLVRYLTERDGGVTKRGEAITRLGRTTGYSIESLRSYAYGRRQPLPGPRLTKLRRAVRNG